MWFLLGDHAAATQPLGSGLAAPRCARDSPGTRLPEGLAGVVGAEQTHPTSTRAKVKISARSLAGELKADSSTSFTDGKYF